MCIDFIFAGEGKLVRVRAWEKRKPGRDAIGFAFTEGTPYPECNDVQCSLVLCNAAATRLHSDCVCYGSRVGSQACI